MMVRTSIVVLLGLYPSKSRQRLTTGLVSLQALQPSEHVLTRANEFISTHLSPQLKGHKFLAIHWRRGDFVALRSSQKDVLVSPEQLVNIIR